MDDLALALRLADEADAISLPRFRSHDFHVSTKPDLTPVTDADQAVEQMLREAIGDERPEDAFYGEEFGSRGQASRRWIVDPIDGTKNFVRGVPVWATLIGLVEDNEVVLGVVSAPALGRRWWATLGSGAWTGRALSSARQLHVSNVSHLQDASLSYSSLDGWAESGRLRAFLNLAQRCWRTRAYGDFWSYMLLAEGAVDMACEPELELYDMAALVPIVTEAGGTFTSLDGESGPWGGNAFATNGHLHKEALSLLNSIEDGEGTAQA